MTAVQFSGHGGSNGGRWVNGADGWIRDALPMSDLPTAHEIIENRDDFGKVVVVPDSGY